MNLWIKIKVINTENKLFYEKVFQKGINRKILKQLMSNEDLREPSLRSTTQSLRYLAINAALFVLPLAHSTLF